MSEHIVTKKFWDSEKKRKKEKKKKKKKRKTQQQTRGITNDTDGVQINDCGLEN